MQSRVPLPFEVDHSIESLDPATPVPARRAFARLDSGRGDTILSRDPHGAWCVLRLNADDSMQPLWREGDSLPQDRPQSREALMLLYPRLLSHLICFSLGYASPLKAASILLDFINDERNWCEWVDHCFGGDTKPVIRGAIMSRHANRGYLADYGAARRLVEAVRWDGQPATMLASWF